MSSGLKIISRALLSVKMVNTSADVLCLMGLLKFPEIRTCHQMASLPVGFHSIDSTDSPDCLPILLSIAVFTFPVFHSLVVGSVRSIKLLTRVSF